MTRLIFTRNTLIMIIVIIRSCAALPASASDLYSRDGGWLYLERPKLGLGTSYELEEEKRTSSGMENKTTSHDLMESMTIGTKGWVYHPNLMKYRLFFEPEWRQERFGPSQSTAGPAQDTRRNTSVLAYDTAATLLGQKACSLDVFANRHTRQIDLTSVQDSDFESETWGTRFNFTNPKMPASFGYVNKKLIQTGFYRSEEDRDEFRARIRHNAHKSVTELNLLYDDASRITRTPPDAPDSTSNTINAELANTFFFTQDDGVRVDSLFYNTRAEYDDTDYNTWVMSENLFWTHGKNLLSRYAFNYNRRDVDDFDTEDYAFRAGLTHRLYDSLTTNLGVEAAASDFAGGGEDRCFSNLGLVYRRPLPWGSLELGAGYDYGITDRSGTAGIIPTEERHILTSASQTYLNRENVDIDSIVVTNGAGTIVYIRDIDYRVEPAGPEARVSRTVLGAIEEGQQVIVRYSYRVDTGFDDSRFGQNYRFDLELWSFLYLTATHGRLNQNVTSGDPGNEPLDDTYNTARIRMDTRWSETQFLYEKQDRSNGNSSVTRSVRQLVTLRPMRNFYLNFSGDYGARDFPDTNEEETFYRLGTDVGWTPRWWCSFSMIGLRDKISGDRQDMLYSEIGPGIRLTYGVWTGTVSYRLRDQKDDDTGDRLWRQRFYIGITRSLW